jgi:hypothetical protein
MKFLSKLKVTLVLGQSSQDSIRKVLKDNPGQTISDPTASQGHSDSLIHNSQETKLIQPLSLQKPNSLDCSRLSHDLSQPGGE